MMKYTKRGKLPTMMTATTNAAVFHGVSGMEHS